MQRKSNPDKILKKMKQQLVEAEKEQHVLKIISSLLTLTNVSAVTNKKSEAKRYFEQLETLLNTVSEDEVSNYLAMDKRSYSAAEYLTSQKRHLEKSRDLLEHDFSKKPTYFYGFDDD